MIVYRNRDNDDVVGRLTPDAELEGHLSDRWERVAEPTAKQLAKAAKRLHEPYESLTVAPVNEGDEGEKSSVDPAVDPAATPAKPAARTRK